MNKDLNSQYSAAGNEMVTTKSPVEVLSEKPVIPYRVVFAGLTRNLLRRFSAFRSPPGESGSVYRGKRACFPASESRRS